MFDFGFIQRSMYVLRCLGVFVVLLLLLEVDGQCVRLLSSNIKCKKGDKEFEYMSLRRCLGTCLSQKKCLFLQWRPNSLKCVFTAKRATTSSYPGPCLTMIKVGCQAFDHTCMEETTGQMYSKDVSVKPVDELDCRSLCVLWTSCAGYTWLQTTCNLQKESSEPVSTSHVQPDAKQGRKNTDCKTGERDVIFRYGANSYGAKKTDVARNMTRCLDLLRGSSKYSSGVWNQYEKVCLLHKKTVQASSLFGKNFNMITLETSTPFRNSTQKACLKSLDGSSYRPTEGVLLVVSSKSECLHICLSTVNCHSVSWVGARICYLYQVPATKITIPNRSLYIVEPCEPDSSLVKSRSPEKTLSWNWRRVSTGIDNIRGLVMVPEVSSLLHCCLVCNRASHCTGVTWSLHPANQKNCYIKTDEEGIAVWKVLSC